MSRLGMKRPRVPPTYRELFFAYNGPGPYQCVFNCGKPVTMFELYVHHIDHNHFNDDPINLSATHHSCHATYHTRLIQRGPQTEFQKLRVSETHKGKPKSEDHVAKIVATRRANAAKRGKTW